MAFDYAGTLTGLETKLKKLKIANGYHFDVPNEQVHRYNLAAEDINNPENEAIIRTLALLIIPGLDTLESQSLDPGHDVRNWNVGVLVFLRELGDGATERLPGNVELLKQDAMGLLKEEYELLSGDLINVRLQQVDPSTIVKEYSDASFAVNVVFVYFG